VTAARAWPSRTATAAASGVEDTYCHRNSSGDGNRSVLLWAARVRSAEAGVGHEAPQLVGFVEREDDPHERSDVGG